MAELTDADLDAILARHDEDQPECADMHHPCDLRTLVAALREAREGWDDEEAEAIAEQGRAEKAEAQVREMAEKIAALGEASTRSYQQVQALRAVADILHFPAESEPDDPDRPLHEAEAHGYNEAMRKVRAALATPPP